MLETENPVAIGNSDNIVDGASSSSSDTDDVTKPLDTTASVVNGFQFPFSVSIIFVASSRNS